jgi:hypothetical protein
VKIDVVKVRNPAARPVAERRQQCDGRNLQQLRNEDV